MFTVTEVPLPNVKATGTDAPGKSSRVRPTSCRYWPCRGVSTTKDAGAISMEKLAWPVGPVGTGGLMAGVESGEGLP